MNRLSVIVPALDEEEVVQSRLMDLCRTTITPDRYEILVGSDGSTDATIDIVDEFVRRHSLGNVRVYDYPNEGKSATINKLVAHSRYEIVLATDADSRFDNPSLFSFLLDQFDAYPRLGAVSCIPVFDTNTVEAGYWRTEVRIRAFLQKQNALFVLTGMGCAFRRSCFEPIPRGVMADDLWIPLTVLRKGFQVVEEPNFKAETTIFSDTREIGRKVRVMKGGMHCFAVFFSRYPSMIPTRVFFWFFVFKVMRWALPIYVLSFLVFVAVGAPLVFTLVAGVFVVSLAVSSRLRYLLLGIAAPLKAFVELLMHRDLSRWSHVR